MVIGTMFGRKKSETTDYSQPEKKENKPTESVAVQPDVTGDAAQQPQAAATGDAKNQEQMRKALNTKLVAASFGEIVSLFMRSSNHKYSTLADLEWLVLPAVVTGQFRLAEARDKDSGYSAPVAVALWASLSDEFDKEFTENVNRPLRLKPNEWKSGDNIWLMEVAGDGRVTRQLLGHLRTEQFKDKTIKMRVRDQQGNLSCMTLDELDKANKPEPVEA